MLRNGVFMRILSLTFILLFASAQPVLAFLQKADKTMVINRLNDLQLEGHFDENNIISFDSIQCQKSSRSCLLHIRIVDPESEFGSIRHGICLIDGINSLYDIIDEGFVVSSKVSSPLTRSFFKAVRNCHGVLESDQDELMD